MVSQKEGNPPFHSRPTRNRNGKKTQKKAELDYLCRLQEKPNERFIALTGAE